MKRAPNLKFLILLMTLLSCGESDFKKFSKLGELRIVAIKADIPEVDGTQTGSVNVTLTPYISDIESKGRVFQVDVVTCLDSGITQGGETECENPNVEVYPNGNSFNTGSLSASNYTGAMDPITITINNPANLISNFSTQQKFNGVNYLVAFRLSSGSTVLNAVKAVSISTRSSYNSNPIISGFEFDGLDLSGSLSKKGKLKMLFSAGSEAYQVMRADGTITLKQENLLISWFVSEGKIRPPRIIDTQFSTFYPKSDNAITLIGVARDRRGGTDVLIISP